MNTSKALAVALTIGLASFAATSQNTADHSQHTAGASAPAAQPSVNAATEPQVSVMDKHLQHMRDLSNKMAEAKTPQERQALMAEHKKAMHEGMKMMGAHSAQTGRTEPDMKQHHAMMEKRMEMMQTMMQMMMDHMHTPAAK